MSPVVRLCYFPISLGKENCAVSWRFSRWRPTKHAQETTNELMKVKEDDLILRLNNKEVIGAKERELERR